MKIRIDFENKKQIIVGIYVNLLSLLKRKPDLHYSQLFPSRKQLEETQLQNSFQSGALRTWSTPFSKKCLPLALKSLT